MRVAAPAPVSELTGLTAWYHLPEPERSRLAANLAKVKAAFSYRCAAYEYRLLAEGSCHFAVFSKLMPWDHAAGVLLHEEAGGYSARFDGLPYRPADYDGGMISAPDRATWTALRATLFG
jgi:fructose-1,6-bisphosphatase/inositol monophosphatase family enzyme